MISPQYLLCVQNPQYNNHTKPWEPFVRLQVLIIFQFVKKNHLSLSEMFKHQKHIQISKYSAVSETRSSLEAQKTQRKVFIKQKCLYSSDDEYSTAENCHISNKLV